MRVLKSAFLRPPHRRVRVPEDLTWASMTTVPIPGLGAAGVLPPLRPGGSSSRETLAFSVSFRTWSSASARRRAAGDPRRSFWVPSGASRRGARRGFQWIDGSFVEDVEAIEGDRPGIWTC